MSRPDLTLISPYPPPGARHVGRSGVWSYAANLATALDAFGLRVAVVAQNEPGVPEVTTDGGITVLRGFDRGPGALRTAANIASVTGAPAVHLQYEVFLYGGPASAIELPYALARLRRDHATVVTLHQVVDPASVDRGFCRMHGVRAPVPVLRTALRGLYGATSRLTDAVVVHERSFRTVVSGSRVIPHGVEELPATDGRGEGRFVVLCFGFLAPYKGLESVLAAAERADGAFELVVAGGEHPRDGGGVYARRLRERWGHVARFTGFVEEDDLPSLFGSAGVVLFAYPRSFSSSGGLALALGYRRPVLLSAPMAEAMGAPPELVVPTESGELADSLSTLATRPEVRERVRTASERLTDGRTWTAVASRHAELYEEVQRARGTARRRVRSG